MKAELKLKKVVITGLLLASPLTVFAGGSQAFKNQQEHGITQHVRDWASIDVNGDHLISAAEMEAYLIKQRGNQEAASDDDPRANLSPAQTLHKDMMYSKGIQQDSGTAPSVTNTPTQWNQVEKLYWQLQPSGTGGFLTAGAGKFQWQLDAPAQESTQIAGTARVLDSTDLGMYFKHGAGKHQPSKRIYLPGTTFTVEIPASGKHQTTTQPENLVELTPVPSDRGG